VNRFIVLYDACVLYPAPLRDLLLRLALTDLYRARWSDAIHEEWIRAVLRNRPDLSRQQLERTRALMNAHVRDALVDGYQTLIPALKLPDLKTAMSWPPPSNAEPISRQPPNRRHLREIVEVEGAGVSSIPTTLQQISGGGS